MLGCGTCGAQCMTYARRMTVGLGRLDEIRLAYCSTPLLCSKYSTGKGVVNGVGSVMTGIVLHLRAVEPSDVAYTA